MQDRTSNLISVITVVRWILKNKKEATRFLPAAGVSPEEINNSVVYGRIIKEALEHGDFSGMQEKLMKENAVTFLPTVYFIEKNGYRLWGMWARFILKKGSYKDPKREPYLWLFCYYLFFVLYVISPIGMIFYFLTYPLRIASFKRVKREVCYELG